MWSSALVFIGSKYSEDSTQKIEYISNNVKNELRWSSEDLQNKPLSTIVPYPVKNYHDQFINNGSLKLLENNEFHHFFAETKYGDTKSVALKLQASYSIANGFRYLSMLEFKHSDEIISF